MNSSVFAARLGSIHLDTDADKLLHEMSGLGKHDHKRMNSAMLLHNI